MRLMSLLRNAAKHAGSWPPCSADGQMSAVRVINSSTQQCFAPLETQSSTCLDPDYPKVLITGGFLSFQFNGSLNVVVMTAFFPLCVI